MKLCHHLSLESRFHFVSFQRAILSTPASPVASGEPASPSDRPCRGCDMSYCGARGYHSSARTQNRPSIGGGHSNYCGRRKLRRCASEVQLRYAC